MSPDDLYTVVRNQDRVRKIETLVRELESCDALSTAEIECLYAPWPVIQDRLERAASNRNIAYQRRAIMAKAKVEIKDMAFVPATVNVKAGDCVCFTNCDSMVHTVTDDGPTTKSQVTSGDIQPGASYDRVFPAMGTFPYHCEKHPSMTGTVTVT